MTDMRKYMNLMEAKKPNNEFLRALDAYVKTRWFVMEQEQRDWITSVFDKHMPELTEAHDVWRGIGLQSWNDLKPECDFMNKDRIIFENYTSTSTDVYMSERFVDDMCNISDYPLGVLFCIDTKPGVKGIVVNEHLPVHKFKHQEEIILNRGAEFNVSHRMIIDSEEYEDEDGKTQTWEYWRVDMEQIA